MFTDIVGYTALMAESEEKGLRVRERHRALVRPLVERYQGEWVDETGDESLSSFHSAVDAVNCALAVQAELRGDSELRLRIGIHLGETLAEGGRLYGDAVNIASRIRPLAEPGGVCVSDEVQHSIRNQPGLETTPLGEHALKNVGRPVSVYAVTGMASQPRVAEELPLPGMDELTVPGFGGAPAVAVLPFDNLSADPEQEYFADGIAEDLITRLSSFRIPVIARNSSFTYKGQPVDVKRVSRELGVRYVVEGSVRKAGERVRISAQLIDATTGRHVWAERYDRQLADVFAVQDEVSEAIVVSMSSELRSFEMERAARRKLRNLDAYDLVLRGFWHLSRRNRDDNAEARSLFERASELDPRYAMASAGLAFTHYLDLAYQWSDAPERSIAELTRAAQRSVALDAKEPLGQLVLGAAYSFTGPQDRMLAAFERAVQLNPSLPLALNLLGGYLALTGRPDDAIEHLETAMRLSPRDPIMVYCLENMAVAHFAAGRYEEAVDWAKRGIQADAGYPKLHAHLSASYAHLGRPEEARRAFEELSRLQPGVSQASLKLAMPSTDPEFLERYLDGLRKAGLKE
jgi:adenylate cyclase